MTAAPADLAAVNDATTTAPPLPRACGPLSEAAIKALSTGRTDGLPAVPAEVEPLGRDLQLTLYTLYELHYRGFDGVDAELEWDPVILRMRRDLERVFLEHLRGAVEPGDDPVAEMDAMSVEATSGTGPSWYFKDEGTWDQIREYFAHRSLYHLKEGDPHAFAIPRLQGQAKASFVAVEFDEFGGGRGDRIHQQLWADLMSAAGLDPSYLGYIDRVSAETLATVNLMSMFGLHRSLRGAAIGHFAAIEITSSPVRSRVLRVWPPVNSNGITPMPTRFERWMRSKLSAITALTPRRLVPFAAQSRLEPAPYSTPPTTTSGTPRSCQAIAAS